MEMPRVLEMGKVLAKADPHENDAMRNVVRDDGSEYWIPARGYQIPNFRKRLSITWRVFTGRLDAIDTNR